MGERSFYTPPEFSHDAGKNADSHSPHVVVRQTDENLKLFFQNETLDREILNDYLSEFTLPMLEHAIGAIPMIKALAHDMGVDTYEEIKQFMQKDGTPDEAAKQVEVFDYTSVVFGAIPDMYRSPLYPIGLARRGAFGPPTDISGYVRRINELHRVTSEIKDGKVKKSSHPTYRTALVRTEAFYDAGAKLPPPTQAEKGKLDLAVEKFNTMLNGIEIDL